MRVLQLAPHFLPFVGGQERFVYYLSREHTRMGTQVTVVTSNFPQGPQHERLEGFDVFRHTCLARPLRNPIIPGMILRWWRQKGFDILHAHNEYGFTSNVAVFLKHLHGIPLVVTSHGQLVFGSPVTDGFRRLYWRTLGKWTLQKANRITVATPSEKKRLESELKIDPEAIDLLPVGIDPEHWDALSEVPNPTYSEARQLEGRRVILAATQLVKRKGLHYLIRAMPEILSSYPQAVCVIAGKGDYERELRSLTAQLQLNQHVLFYGLLSDPELAQCYQAADVFVLPSLGEGQPTCIMEAWAFSKPVVATRIDGVIDYYEDAAVLVEPAQTQPLAQEILGLLEDQSRATRFGEEGRQLVESSLTWDRIAARMLHTYESAIKMHKGSI